MNAFAPYCSARLQAGIVDSRICSSAAADERYSFYPKMSFTFSKSEESR
jgi:hypothetical protein